MLIWIVVFAVGTIVTVGGWIIAQRSRRSEPYDYAPDGEHLYEPVAFGPGGDGSLPFGGARTGPIQDTPIRWSSPGRTFPIAPTGLPLSARKVANMDRDTLITTIVRILDAAPGPLTCSQIRVELSYRGRRHSWGTVANALTVTVRDGRVLRIGHGVYTTPANVRAQLFIAP